MFNLGRKGQGTTEYLIILAVIIVVALVVAGVMGWFPGLAGDISESQSHSYWGATSPLALSDWSVTTAGAAFTVQNNSSSKIQLTDISLDNTALGLADQNVSAGSSVNTPVDNTVTCTAGQVYSYDVIISYDVVGGLASKTFTGSKKLVGTCP